ncbi:hypothetical protein SNEBB_000583 [Seison nebaliae]|nr:hypothetical protein SNEBB_000583 [Seison nebaliae]
MDKVPVIQVGRLKKTKTKNTPKLKSKKESSEFPNIRFKSDETIRTIKQDMWRLQLEKSEKREDKNRLLREKALELGARESRKRHLTIAEDRIMKKERKEIENKMEVNGISTSNASYHKPKKYGRRIKNKHRSCKPENTEFFLEIMTKLNVAEKVFVLHGVLDNFRIDGRSNNDYRTLFVSKDVINVAYGSAKVVRGDSQVIVGLKAKIGERSKKNKNYSIESNSFSCTSVSQHQLSLITHYLEEIVEQSKLPESLLIKDTNNTWILNIDVVVVQNDGSLIDLSSVGLLGALADLKLPNLTISVNENGQKEIDLNEEDGDGEQRFLEVIPHMNIVITCGVAEDCVVFDMSSMEEACVTTSLTASVDSTGQISHLSLSGQKSLNEHSLKKVTEIMCRIATSLHQDIRKRLVDDESIVE